MPNKMLWHTEHIAYIPMVQKLSVCTCQTCQIKLMGVGHCFVWCYGYSIYISYITYPIIPTQTFVIKSPSLYLFSYISFYVDHASLLNSKKPFFYLLAFLVIVEYRINTFRLIELSTQTFT